MPKYRGTGGAEFDIDPPAEGTGARKRFDAQVEAGGLVPVAAAEPEKATAAKKAPAAKKPAED